MKNLLVTGGTVFVSKFVATYFKNRGYKVYVLNRNTRKQVNGVNLVCCDRNNIGDLLRNYCFDVVIDVCAYNKNDIKNLLDSLCFVKDYIFISSSAVYPETNNQPFNEEQKIGCNSLWKDYGKNKVLAEEYLLERKPDSYILRPPYIYGPMQNLYREPFVFECAINNREFYIPKDGKMKLQFFHVEDLCKLIEIIFKTHPKEHILNVGNVNLTDINEFVELCYEVASKNLKKVYVKNCEDQMKYFCFRDYEFSLDVSKQSKLIKITKDLKCGLKESYDWYIKHMDDVNKKSFIQFIDNALID